MAILTAPFPKNNQWSNALERVWQITLLAYLLNPNGCSLNRFWTLIHFFKQGAQNVKYCLSVKFRLAPDFPCLKIQNITHHHTP